LTTQYLANLGLWGTLPLILPGIPFFVPDLYSYSRTNDNRFHFGIRANRCVIFLSLEPTVTRLLVIIYSHYNFNHVQAISVYYNATTVLLGIFTFSLDNNPSWWCEGGEDVFTSTKLVHASLKNRIVIYAHFIYICVLIMLVLIWI
jgi:hypothetical protein